MQLITALMHKLELGFTQAFRFLFNGLGRRNSDSGQLVDGMVSTVAQMIERRVDGLGGAIDGVMQGRASLFDRLGYGLVGGRFFVLSW